MCNGCLTFRVHCKIYSDNETRNIHSENGLRNTESKISDNLDVSVKHDNNNICYIVNCIYIEMVMEIRFYLNNTY